MMRWVFAGTFDPITRGHELLISRAVAVCDSLIVAVAASPNKTPWFSGDERLRMVQSALPERAEAFLFNGLLVDFCKTINANALIRGLRDSNDFVYEQQLAAVNRHLGIETLFFNSYAETALISSTMVKELARLDGDFSPFVNSSVAEMLKIKADSFKFLG